MKIHIQTKEIPIIALTADAMVDHVAKYKEAGLSAVVAKPIIPAELSQAIDKFSLPP